MIATILSFFNDHNISKTSPLLVSVSGGKDSMVLLDILNHQGYNIGVAHINHSTRNGESDLDEDFVKSYCAENDIPFYAKKLDYEKLSEGNFQNNARIARKQFLESMLHKYEYILTAHHANDNFETVLMNLNRGSGLAGMRGIIAYDPPYIRPMLHLQRSQIDEYQRQHNVPFREDSSNASDDYLRNRIRHHIGNKITEILPNVIPSTSKTTDILSQEYALLNELVDKYKEKILSESNGLVSIDLEKIEVTNPELLLFYLLKPYGFELSMIQDIYNAKTGAIVENGSFEILKNRNTLLLRPIKNIEYFECEITDYGCHSTPLGDVYLSESVTEQVPKHLVLKDIEFPVTLRLWKPGDHFKPQGMKGKSKKVKDFLTDLKCSRFEKDQVMVLVEKGIIIQIVGYRNGIR